MLSIMTSLANIVVPRKPVFHGQVPLKSKSRKTSFVELDPADDMYL